MTAPAPLVALEYFEQLVDGDELQQTRLDGVLAAIRGYCGWHIAPAYDATFVVDGPGGRVLSLPTLHLNSVASVTENGAAIADDAYEWSHDGTLRRSCNWTSRYRGVVVVANHGYPQAPGDLLAVVLDAASRAMAVPVGEDAADEPETVGPFSWGARGGSIEFTATERVVLDRFRVSYVP